MFGMFNLLKLKILSSFFFFFWIDYRKTIFDAPPEDPNYQPLPEDRPGGFNWGDGQPVGAAENEHEDWPQQWQ